MKRQRTVLLSLLGESPGVLTETLWGLAESHPGHFPDEISILTTRKGKEVFESSLADKILPGLMQRIREEFALDVPRPVCVLHVFHGRDALQELDDLRNREDVEIAGDAMLRWVRAHVFEENTRLLASVSGGPLSFSASHKIPVRFHRRSRSAVPPPLRRRGPDRESTLSRP